MLTNTYGLKRMLPAFSTYVKRVFGGCQKLFWLFSKALLTVVKNYQNFTSLCVNLFCYACGILLIFYRKAPNYSRKTLLFMKRILRFESKET